MWPDMTGPLEPRSGATDIMFGLARTELGKFIQKAMPLFGNWSRMFEDKDLHEMEARLEELEELMEMKYLRYCDFAVPLHNLVMAMCRTAISSGRLRLKLPKVKNADNETTQQRAEVWYVLEVCKASHDLRLHVFAMFETFANLCTLWFQGQSQSRLWITTSLHNRMET